MEEEQQTNKDFPAKHYSSTTTTTTTTNPFSEQIWHLAEIFYFSDVTHIDKLFFDWYKQHFDKSEHFINTIDRITHPQEEPHFWPLVYQ
jgi:hypothetical protein